MKKIYFSMALIFFLVTSGFLAAGPAELPYRWEDDSPKFSCLDLTFEQTKKIRNLKKSLEKETSRLKIREFERKAELRLLWMQMKPDSKMLKAKQKKIHGLKWQIQEKNTDFWLKFRNTLTEEQLSEFLAITGEPEYRQPAPRRPRPPRDQKRRQRWED
ncbi:MAG: hypothetical protein GY749_34330 [Desulfobacteraceae bacterium]|nr:hypothetical protein [Desulfobacteraceae bacterium]